LADLAAPACAAACKKRIILPNHIGKNAEAFQKLDIWRSLTQFLRFEFELSVCAEVV